MRLKQNKYENFFVRLFPSVILQNKIVASIIDIVLRRTLIMKDDIDNHLNNDI